MTRNRALVFRINPRMVSRELLYLGKYEEKYGRLETTLVAILRLVWLARSRVSSHPPVPDARNEE
jgi:hypothetical protein